MAESTTQHPLRVAYLCPRYLITRGGAELLTRRLAEEMADRGHEVTVFAADPGGERKGFLPEESPRLRVRELPRSMCMERLFGALRGLEHRKGGYRLFRMLTRDGRRLVLGKGPYCRDVAKRSLYAGFDAVTLMAFNTPWEILFGRIADSMAPAAVLACPLFHVREPSADLPVHDRMLRRFDHVLTLTDFEKQHLVKKGWEGDRITSIGVGSDLYVGSVSPERFRERHGIAGKAPIVLFVGRKIYNKGVTHLVQAMDEVWDPFPDARLVLLGFSHNPPEWLDGYLGRSRHDAKALTINLDDASEDARENALAACSVMALPSISDSFGIVYLEAWRYGKPVVGCRDTCCDFFIEHGKDGLLVDFGNVRELGRALVTLLQESDKSARMGERGRAKWRDHYQWSMVADRMEEALKRVERMKTETA